MSLRTLALLGFAVIGALPLRADVIPTGHKPVEHLLVLSEALANGEVLAAAPTRGFHGVQTVVPGAPFSFSSKYGTRLYALPAGAAMPDDLEALRAAAIASADIPVTQVTSVSLLDPLTSIVTTLRVTLTPEGGLSIQVLDEERILVVHERLLSILAVLGVVGCVGLVGIVLLARKRARASKHARP